jgi:5-methylcytosine-specific restriction endonuclease McrA
VERRTCNKCGETKPLTTQYFNKLSTGNWRGVCKTCMADNTRRHYKESPEKVLARVQKYKEQKAAAGGHHDEWDIHQIRKKLGDQCNYCGEPLLGKGEKDHLVPVSRGGDNSSVNLTLACRTCNRDKHAKTAQEFLAWRRDLGLKVRNER